ncbi:ferritin [Siphonobacter aquaeclarae]|jgi:ferritin|uniref:Ferritin n=1 Tax=Siphonobacter aquaeclarae TaxID=563176 RepID=A0A1G9W2Q0_9BACT|nr:ferritin [Siphonobacter aquaeclarae]SDM78466.1 ferritin [Siphonobacter aquaeclarae]
MKDLQRLRTSLKEEVEIALNAQVKMEAEASSKYLAMASWCDRNGYRHSADYFYKQSDEERGHMLKIFHYLADQGATAYAPEIGAVAQDYASFREVFETALQSEINVTNAINRIVGLCRKIDDYATESFLQWFVQEQIEEEQNARRAVELFDVIGEAGTGRFQIDKEIAKINGAE